MVITKIELQVKNKNRCSVFIDDKFSFGIGVSDLVNYDIRENKTLTVEEYNYLLDEVIFVKARDKAINYIAYRTRSKKEVMDKLKTLDYNYDTIEKVVELLEKYLYIDDYKFATLFYKDKINLRKHGSIKIKYELRQKGVSDDIINKILLENADNCAEEEKAYELLVKKTKGEIITEYKEKKKVQDYLLRRGFSYDIINSAFNKLELDR